MTRTPTEMELRVAKAMYVNAGGEDADDIFAAPFIDPEIFASWLNNARAAIRAMREPTMEMCAAGWEEVPACGIRPDAMKYPWRFMIDAASPQERKCTCKRPDEACTNCPTTHTDGEQPT